MSSTNSPAFKPKIFASYAWSEERSTMVREVCERLKGDGVSVLLDQWYLKEGDDVYHFMEQCVKDASVTAVLIFCDRLYAVKADKRLPSGVSAESQMISPELYHTVSDSKFIPIICERDEQQKECRPQFVKSRFYIDFSSEELINANWEQLLRRIYGKPQFSEPPLGPAPSYILEPLEEPRQSAGKFLYWKQTAAKNGPLLSTAEKDYITALTKDLKSVYLGPGEETYEFLTEKFEPTKSVRDELLEIFAVNASGAAGRPGSGRVGAILDRLLDLRSIRHTGNSRSGLRNEVLDLFLYELFLYTIAQLLTSEEYQLTANLLERYYPAGDDSYHVSQRPPTFTTFYTHSSILVQYNSTQSRMYLDYQSEVISRRCTRDDLPQNLLVEADLVLAVRAICKEDKRWFSRFLRFRENFPVLPFFDQAQRREGFKNLAVVLGVTDRQELAAAFADKIKRGKDSLGFWQQTESVANVIGLSRIIEEQ